jgi:hypothetical protein
MDHGRQHTAGMGAAGGEFPRTVKFLDMYMIE